MHVVAADARELHALQRVPELLVDVVRAHVGADGRVEAHAVKLFERSVARLAAVERAAIDLLDLVAVVRIARVEREVREQVEAIRADVGERLELAVLVRAELVLRRELVARGVAAFVGIDRSEARAWPCSTARAGICPEPCQFPP